jgi:hypothetical protein
MPNNSYQYLKDAFASPLGDFIASIGEGVGEAQAAMDEGSLRQTLEIYNQNPDDAGDTLKLFREIGYQPTFYTIPKTTAKAKISLTLSQKSDGVLNNNRAFRPKMYVTPVNATNSNKFSLDLNASAEIQFDIVPVPPSDSQIIRFLPNAIEKQEQNSDGNTITVKRTLGEIKNLLLEYGLSYTFVEGTDESIIDDDTTFSKQYPEFIAGKTQILKLGDTIALEL